MGCRSRRPRPLAGKEPRGRPLPTAMEKETHWASVPLTCRQGARSRSLTDASGASAVLIGG